MRKTILVLACCCFALANGFSQTKKESIEELFKVMKTDSTMVKSFDAILPAMMSQIPKAKDASQQKEMDKKVNTIMSMAKEMAQSFLKEDMVEVYANSFTESDIEELIKFYKTPVGQKFIDKTPEIQKEIMTKMMQKYIPELQKKMKANFEAN